MGTKAGAPIDYREASVRQEILDRQRRDMWTPEQLSSLAKYFRLRPGMRLLDAGCGHGYSMRAFGHFCMPKGTLVGCDRDQALLSTACAEAHKEGLGEAVTFCSGDIYRLPLDSNSFDVAIAQVVLCHLSAPEKALDELIRVTKPGGCVVVIDNARPSGLSKAWNNVAELNLTQELFRYEALLRWRRGRRKLGLGDFAVGCQAPAWMEARGLKDVDARQNEKVDWIAPPYASPAQQTELQKTKERAATQLWRSFGKALNFDAWYRAGGADDRMVAKINGCTRRDMQKISRAMSAGTLAHSVASWLWCVWGFK